MSSSRSCAPAGRTGPLHRTVAVAVIGAVLVGLIFGWVTDGLGGFEPAGWLVAALGALAAVFLDSRFIAGPGDWT